MAYLAAVSLASGRAVGLLAVAGVAAGLALVGLLAAFGLTGAIDAVPAAHAVLRYAGAFYMLWLAYDAWRGEGEGALQDVSAFTALRRGFVTNLLNPKAAAFFVTVMPEFVGPGEDVLAQNLRLVVVYVVVATFVHASIVAFAGGLRPYLVQGRREQLVRRTLAVMLAAVAVWFFARTGG